MLGWLRFAGLRVTRQPGSPGFEMVAHATISWLCMASVLAQGENPHVALNAGERWPPKNFRVPGVLPVAAEDVRTGIVARERRAPEEARLDVLRRVRVALFDSSSAFRALATIARAVDLEGLLEGFLDGAVGGARIFDIGTPQSAHIFVVFISSTKMVGNFWEKSRLTRLTGVERSPRPPDG